MSNLEGKVAVITGSAVGIGRGVAVALAERGANIAALDIDITNNLETAHAVRAAGRDCLAVDCDVGDKVQVRRAINQTLQAFGRIDVLVNNAAVYENSALLTGTFESQTAAFDQAMGSCAMGAYYCARACVDALVKSGDANIVNIITEHIKEGHFLTGPALGYDCAKWSMWRQTETWAVELAERGVRVNALCMGAVDTPMLRAAAPQVADNAMTVEDMGRAVLHVIDHGPGGPTGQSYLFGTTGSKREDSIVEIAALAAGG